MEHFLQTYALLWVYGLSGTVLLFLGYKIFDWLTPKIDVEKELVENKNMSVAVVVGAVVLGLAWVIAATIRG